MNRDYQGRFSSFKSWMVKKLKQLLAFVFISTAVVAVVASIVYHYGNYAARASVTATSTVTLSERWDANYEKDVELELERSGFKKQMEDYARTVAEQNVRQAYLTKLEQKIK